MSARRMLLITVPLLAATLALSACGSAADPASTATATPKPSATGTPTATATATAVPDPAPTDEVETGQPVGVSCDDVVSPQQMYDFNPNYGLLNGFVPDGGSLAGQAVAANGIACRWLNQSNGATIDVSVALLDSTSTFEPQAIPRRQQHLGVGFRPRRLLRSGRPGIGRSGVPRQVLGHRSIHRLLQRTGCGPDHGACDGRPGLGRGLQPS